MMHSTPPPDSEPSGQSSQSVKDAFAGVGNRFAEMREYVDYYASVKVDALKLKATRIGVYVALGLVGLVVVITVMAAAAVLLLRGLAEGINQLLGGNGWAGDLIVGVLVLLIPVVGGIVGMKVVGGILRRKLMEKYEARHQQQRERFGSDVFERSRQGQEKL